MNTNAPRSITWIVAVAIGAIGILGYFISIPVISAYAFWLVVVGLVILAVATVIKGL